MGYVRPSSLLRGALCLLGSVPSATKYKWLEVYLVSGDAVQLIDLGFKRSVLKHRPLSPPLLWLCFYLSHTHYLDVKDISLAGCDSCVGNNVRLQLLIGELE